MNKLKKPQMEKFRRDRMNKSLDDCKHFVIKYNLAETSKLEKADILEKTVDLLKFFDTFFNQKGQQKFLPNIRPLKQSFYSPAMSQNFISSAQHQYVQQLLLQQQQHRQQQQQLLSNPLMTSTPKTQRTQPLLTPCIPSTTTTFTPIPTILPKEIIRPTSCYELRPITAETTPSIDDNVDELIDIENIDKNEETFSPPLTPPKRLKRSFSCSVDTDDSGVSNEFESETKRPKLFSIDGLLR